MCSHIVDELPLAGSTTSSISASSEARAWCRRTTTVARVSYCIVPPALRRLKALLEAV